MALGQACAALAFFLGHGGFRVSASGPDFGMALRVRALMAANQVRRPALRFAPDSPEKSAIAYFCALHNETAGFSI
jgi:hypothetical protein